jgi:hypothetical protein
MACAAGLFEGEGCITISDVARKGDSKVYQQPRLKLNMIDEDVVRRFHAIIGVGNICIEPPRRAGTLQQWCWYTGKRPEVRYVLMTLLPWLGNRRLARALEVLGVIESQERAAESRTAAAAARRAGLAA